MPFKIIRNDITKVAADVIVNTANPKPVIGSGTDSAVYRAAGINELLSEREKIGDILPGESRATSAFKLPAKHIIHTVGPAWIDGNHGEKDILRSCYANSLKLAVKLKAESIAFPLIATGVYRFPKDEALNIALAEIGKFLLLNDMNVILVVFDRKSFELSAQLIGDINELIDEHNVNLLREDEYKNYDLSTYFRIINNVNSLDNVLSNIGDTFQQRLFKLIDASGMDDVTVYKKANIDRKLFSHIRCNENYKPKKITALALAIALELDFPTMLDLLARAEIAFSPSNISDLIIEHFVTKGIFDIFEINAALFKYEQPLLGE